MSISRQEAQWREWLYHCARYRPRADRGTPYPCSQMDLDRCFSLTATNPYQYVELMEATYQLVRFNRVTKPLSPDEVAALSRLTRAVNIVEWGPDLAIKAFKDLDTLFFMGRLSGNCQVRWSDHKMHDYGTTESLAHGQAKIWLNARLVLMGSPEEGFTDPFVEMWRVSPNCSSRNMFSCGYFVHTLGSALS